MPRLTDEQLDERATGLGASDVVVAAGLSPYSTPFELYLEKTGQLVVEETFSDRARNSMERGHRLEDVALEWDRDANGGERFYRVNRTIRHKRLPFLFCHPDAARDRKLSRLVEVKTTPKAWKSVPPYVEAQVQVQMACTGATSVDVVVLTFDGPPARFVVDRDGELIDALEDVAAAFWDRVVRRDPPPLDGSSGARRWLDSTRFAGEEEMRASEIQRRLLADLVVTRAEIARLQAADDLLVNEIEFSMAGASRLTAPGIGRVVWTAPRTARTTQWKEVATEYRTLIEAWAAVPGAERTVEAPAAPDLDEIESRYTSEREDVRAFIFTEQREEPLP